MHLKSIRLKEFRGFSDLTLTDVPATARLVMLIGPNGTGKSSIFDALLSWTGANGAGYAWDYTFHVKQSATKAYEWNTAIEKVELYELLPATPEVWKRLCYFRTAYRNEPELQRVLPHLKMESLGDPSESTGNFYFTKGISRRYLFKNPSGGEKSGLRSAH